MGKARTILAIAAVGALASGAVSQTPAPASAANAALIEQGRYLAVLGDCASCHTRPGGQPFAGGLPLKTPFGAIYSANITPDKDTGMGGWSEADFYRAMHEGRDDQRHHLYPAMPYPYYTLVPRAEVDAIRAYLLSVKSVAYTPPANTLPFPLNIRWGLTFWNGLYLKEGDWRPSAGRSAAWNRGAYIVQGLGHCGACHTPKTLAMGDKRDDALQGGVIDNWFASDLNGDRRGGLGSWSAADIVEFLKTGRNARSSASGSMSLVVQVSTSKMTDPDLAAIAVYLKSLPASKAANAASPATPVMAAGRAIYTDECAACHKADGAGVPRFFPPLAGNANVQSSDPTTLDRFILTGTQAAATDARPTALSMPAFAWKLTNAQVAAVATYVRNSWGNAASPVSADMVGGLRGKVAAHPIRKPPGRV
ncbi:MAG: cytochrome c [Pseudomonadota bacterium]|nr:cytochrome c [Pseudomonadota bacterium]